MDITVNILAYLCDGGCCHKGRNDGMAPGLDQLEADHLRAFWDVLLVK